MDVNYLTTRIVEKRETKTPSYGMTKDGYTKNSGAPTQWLVRLENETRWRRLMVLQFSNAGSCFLNIKGNKVFVKDYQMPDVA